MSSVYRLNIEYKEKFIHPFPVRTLDTMCLISVSLWSIACLPACMPACLLGYRSVRYCCFSFKLMWMMMMTLVVLLMLLQLLLLLQVALMLS